MGVVDGYWEVIAYTHSGARCVKVMRGVVLRRARAVRVAWSETVQTRRK